MTPGAFLLELRRIVKKRAFPEALELARREHALLGPPPTSSQGEEIGELMEFVLHGLEAAGLPIGEGRVMSAPGGTEWDAEAAAARLDRGT